MQQDSSTAPKDDKKQQSKTRQPDPAKKYGANKAELANGHHETRDTKNKYNKLKKKYRHLREEYNKVLDSWEFSTKCIKSLNEERK